MNTKQLVKKLIDEGKTRDQVIKIAKRETGKTHDYIRRTFKDLVPGNEDYRFKKDCVTKAKAVVKIKKSNSSRDIIQSDEFIGGIDVVRQVMAFLNNEIKDNYIEDEKLRRRFEITIGKWKEIKSLPVFNERLFIYTKPTGQKEIVWSSKRGVKMARETISMARYEL